MHGMIDEFVLFETAYDESEIRRLFEIGSPYETPLPRITGLRVAALGGTA